MATYETFEDYLIANPTKEPAASGKLSKLNLDGTVYYIKDAAIRDYLASVLDTAASAKVATAIGAAAISSTETGLVTGAQVAAAVAGLAGAMHFVGAVTTKPTDLSAYSNGDVIVVKSPTGTDPDDGKEYVVLKPEGEAGTLIELGNEKGHVLASDLKAMAYADKGETDSAVLTALDPVSVTASLADTDPLTFDSTATVTFGGDTPIKSVSMATVGDGDTADYTPELDTSSKSSVATHGLVASIDDTDNEMLVLSAETNSVNALTNVSAKGIKVTSTAASMTGTYDKVNGVNFKAVSVTPTGTASKIEVSPKATT